MVSSFIVRHNVLDIFELNEDEWPNAVNSIPRLKSAIRSVTLGFNLKKIITLIVSQS